MRVRSAAIAALLVGAPLALAACGNDGTGGDDGTFKVVVSGGVSAQGPLKANSSVSILATKAAVKTINANGGIGGCQVELTVVDDGGDATKAVTAANQALAEHSPQLYLNSGPTNLTAALGPAMRDAGVLFMATGSFEGSGDPKQYPLTFELSTAPAKQAAGIAAFMRKDGHSKVAVIHGNSAFAAALGDALSEAVPDAGLELTGIEEYDSLKTLDMTAQLSALRDGNPDALFVNGYGAPVGYVLQGLKKLGWDVPIYGDPSVGASELMQQPAPDGIIGSPVADRITLVLDASNVHNPDDELMAEMLAAMKDLGKIETSIVNAWNWDGLQLVKAAADKAGNCTDLEQIAKNLEDPAVTSTADTALIKEYNYTADSHSADPGLDAYATTPPTLGKDGQYGNPDS